MQTPKLRPLSTPLHPSASPRPRKNSRNSIGLKTLPLAPFVVANLTGEVCKPLILAILQGGGWGITTAARSVLGTYQRLHWVQDTPMDRLYYDNPSLLEFDATVTGVEERGEQAVVSLDRSAFYPTSGGQIFDTGEIFAIANGSRVRVINVQENEQTGDVLHLVECPPGWL